MSILRFKSEQDIPAHLQARMRSPLPAKPDDVTATPNLSREIERGETEGIGSRIDAPAHKQEGGVVSKYRAVKTTVDDITFSSKAEAKRYQQLKALAWRGLIWDLKLQPVFVLADAVTINGRRRPSLRYVADFAYDTPEGRVVEDVKGMLTPAYKIKRHLMKSQLGIDIVEITK